jgi:hypothetical protein
MSQRKTYTKRNSLKTEFAYFFMEFSCESEARMCVRNSGADAAFDVLASSLSDLCTLNLRTMTLTTAALSTFKDMGCLSTVIPACQSVISATSQCSSSYNATQNPGLWSCACQPRVTQQASLCAIYGASCLGTSVATTDIYIYQHCGYGQVNTLRPDLTDAIGSLQVSHRIPKKN